MDSDTALLIAFIVGAIAFLIALGFMYTLWIAAKEAHEYFARRNAIHRMDMDDDE